jgi:hypothetical protein
LTRGSGARRRRCRRRLSSWSSTRFDRL